MPLTDLETIFVPVPGYGPPVAWFTAIRDDIEWIARPPEFSINTTAGSGTACANNTLQDVACDHENYDPDGMHTGTNSYVTIGVAGRWNFWTTTQWLDGAVPASGDRLLEFFRFVNLERFTVIQQASAPNPFQTCFSGTRTVQCAVGDTIQVRVRHTAYAGSVTAEVLEFIGRWIGR